MPLSVADILPPHFSLLPCLRLSLSLSLSLLLLSPPLSVSLFLSVSLLPAQADTTHLSPSHSAPQL